MIVWDEDESFCLVPYIDIDERYAYSWIYKTVDLEQSQFALIGAVATSVDDSEDRFIFQFFNDEDITDYFANRITMFADEIDANWLLSQSLMDARLESIFIAEPFVIRGDSAEDVCHLLFEAANQRSFVIKDPNIGDLHQI